MIFWTLALPILPSFFSFLISIVLIVVVKNKVELKIRIASKWIGFILLIGILWGAYFIIAFYYGLISITYGWLYHHKYLYQYLIFSVFLLFVFNIFGTEIIFRKLLLNYFYKKTNNLFISASIQAFAFLIVNFPTLFFIYNFNLYIVFDVYFPILISAFLSGIIFYYTRNILNSALFTTGIQVFHKFLASNIIGPYSTYTYYATSTPVFYIGRVVWILFITLAVYYIINTRCRKNILL